MTALVALALSPLLQAATPPPPAGSPPRLGTRWHADPDADGVPDGRDVCPDVHDPLQRDANGDGRGDACDSSFAPPARGGPVTDLHAETVTPFGAWLNFTSPHDDRYGWPVAVAWSRDASELATRAGFEAAFRRGGEKKVHHKAAFGIKPVSPLILTELDPATTYHVAVARFTHEGVSADIGRPITFTTLPHPVVAPAVTHPRVWATPARLEALRARVAAGDKRLRAWMRAVEPTIFEATGGKIYLARMYCAAAALIHAITGDREMKAAALALFEHSVAHWEKNLLTRNQYRWENAQLGVCLDILWKELPAAQRVRAVAALVRSDDANWEGLRFEDTDEIASLTRTQLVHGLSLCGAPGIPQALARRVCRNLDRALRLWYGLQLPKTKRDTGAWAKSGGYMPDGSFYGPGTSGYWVESFWAMHNALGGGAAAYAPWLWNNFLAQRVHPLTPSRRGIYTQGDNENFRAAFAEEFGSLGLGEPMTDRLMLQAQMLGEAGRSREAAVIRGFARELYKVAPTSAVTSVLLGESDAHESLDPRAALPTVYYDSGQEILFDRTSWGPRASLLVFKLGWDLVDHTHADQGHFQLYRKGAWITFEAASYGGPSATAAGHNVWSLAHGEGEEAGVGQVARAPAATLARMLRVASGPRHAYAAADLTGTYTPATSRGAFYDRVERAILWIKSDEQARADTVVLLDAVEARPDAPARLERFGMLHFRDAPVIKGRTATVRVRGGLGEQRAEVAVPWPASVTLVPLAAAPSINEVAGPTYTNRIKIVAGPERSLRVVTVLRAVDAGAPPLAGPVTTTAGPGFLVTLAGSEAVVVPQGPLPARGGALDALTVKLPDRGVERLWLTGLDPGGRFDVVATRGGGALAVRVRPGGPLAPDAGGVLALALGAAGTVAPLGR